MSNSHSIFNNLYVFPLHKRLSIYPWAVIFIRWINFSYTEFLHFNKHNTVKTHLLHGTEAGVTRKRLVYCKTRGVSTTANIEKIGFQSKQWIGYCPNHSVAYTAKVGVRETLGPSNKRVLTVN